MAEIAEELARALMDEQQQIAVGIAHQMRHGFGAGARSRSGNAHWQSSGAGPNGSFDRSRRLHGIEGARPQRTFEARPAGRRMAVIDVRRGPEEAVAADLALERAGRQIGMGLARGFAFDAGKFDPVLAHAALVSLQHAAA